MAVSCSSLRIGLGGAGKIVDVEGASRDCLGVRLGLFVVGAYQLLLIAIRAMGMEIVCINGTLAGEIGNGDSRVGAFHLASEARFLE